MHDRQHGGGGAGISDGMRDVRRLAEPASGVWKRILQGVLHVLATSRDTSLLPSRFGFEAVVSKLMLTIFK
eukprot:g39956.t1